MQPLLFLKFGCFVIILRSLQSFGSISEFADPKTHSLNENSGLRKSEIMTYIAYIWLPWQLSLLP